MVSWKLWYGKTCSILFEQIYLFTKPLIINGKNDAIEGSAARRNWRWNHRTGEQTKHIPLGIQSDAWAFETSNSYYDIKRERWTAKLLNDQSVARERQIIHNSPRHYIFFTSIKISARKYEKSAFNLIGDKSRITAVNFYIMSMRPAITIKWRSERGGVRAPRRIRIKSCEQSARDTQILLSIFHEVISEIDIRCERGFILFGAHAR